MGKSTEVSAEAPQNLLSIISARVAAAVDTKDRLYLESRNQALEVQLARLQSELIDERTKVFTLTRLLNEYSVSAIDVTDDASPRG